MMQALAYISLGVLIALVLGWLKSRLTTFVGQKAIDYTHDTPKVDIRRDLNGAMICEGTIFGPWGRMTSSFTAEFNAVWEGDRCTLSEDFSYSNGDRQLRKWVIEMQGQDRFTATAEDVPGPALGEISGAAVLFRYPIRLPADAGGYTLRALDCLYLAPNGVLVNRSQFRYYGVKVAELIATIRKTDEVT